MTKTAKKLMGRPPTYTDKTIVCIAGGEHPRPKLQARSERRAIVNLLMDRRGRMTLKQIDDHFGYGVRQKVRALVNNGWLEVVDPEEAGE